MSARGTAMVAGGRDAVGADADGGCPMAAGGLVG